MELAKGMSSVAMHGHWQHCNSCTAPPRPQSAAAFGGHRRVRRFVHVGLSCVNPQRAEGPPPILVTAADERPRCSPESREPCLWGWRPREKPLAVCLTRPAADVAEPAGHVLGHLRFARQHPWRCRRWPPGLGFGGCLAMRLREQAGVVVPSWPRLYWRCGLAGLAVRLERPAGAGACGGRRGGHCG